MQRDRSYVIDIIEAARLALSYVEGVEIEAFISDSQLQDSVIRRIEIMGEAARRVSHATRLANPHIPWREMVGMRNLMIHDYDDVDVEVVWRTVKESLPPVIEQLITISYLED